MGHSCAISTQGRQASSSDASRVAAQQISASPDSTVNIIHRIFTRAINVPIVVLYAHVQGSQVVATSFQTRRRLMLASNLRRLILSIPANCSQDGNVGGGISTYKARTEVPVTELEKPSTSSLNTSRGPIQICCCQVCG